MAGPAEPNGKKTRKESKREGSQSKFPHIFHQAGKMIIR
jgi:hypothetical protein